MTGKYKIVEAMKTNRDVRAWKERGAHTFYRILLYVLRSYSTGRSTSNENRYWMPLFPKYLS